MVAPVSLLVALIAALVGAASKWYFDRRIALHTTWTCKYHLVFIPKCRRKALYQELGRYLGEVFRRHCQTKIYTAFRQLRGG